MDTLKQISMCSSLGYDGATPTVRVVDASFDDNPGERR
jgi:hypothetical protein